MKKILIFIVGLVLGIIISISGYIYFNNNEYYALKSDYCIENVGTLKKGTLLKFNKAYSEGFTSYVLYINIKGEELEFRPQKRKDIVIPYWLHSDSICE